MVVVLRTLTGMKFWNQHRTSFPKPLHKKQCALLCRCPVLNEFTWDIASSLPTREPHRQNIRSQVSARNFFTYVNHIMSTWIFWPLPAVLLRMVLSNSPQTLIEPPHLSLSNLLEQPPRTSSSINHCSHSRREQTTLLPQKVPLHSEASNARSQLLSAIEYS